MDNFEEKILNAERRHIEETERLKNGFESEIGALIKKAEFEKARALLAAENKCESEKEGIRRFFDAKISEDIQKVKDYYIGELESQKNWYENEIVKRQKETENWHINNLNEKINSLKTAYEAQICAKDEEIKKLYAAIGENEARYTAQIEALSGHINELNDEYKRKSLKYKLKKLKSKIKKTFFKGSEKPRCCIYAAEEAVNKEKPYRPKVSVILPIYNTGKYLRQSLDSLINQTLRDIEIICVNDGSTDDCYDILEEYKLKDNRIKVLHKKNGGTGAARNDGLKIASGECIGFVDPDDFVKPEMFERLYSLIIENNLDIAMCMPDGYDEKNKKNAPFPYFVEDNWKKLPVNKVFNREDVSPFQYPMCVWNKLYTKRLFDENGIDFAEGLDFEDHKVIFGSLLTAKRIMFIKDKLYIYRYNREGSVLTDNNSRLTDHIEIFNIVEKLMKDTGTFDALRFDFLTYKIHNILYYYGMIKEEYKADYREKMVTSLKETDMTDEEYEMLAEKYPELRSVYVKN